MANVLVLADDKETAAHLTSMLVALGHHADKAHGAADVARRPPGSWDVIVLQRAATTSLRRLASRLAGVDESRKVPILAVVDRQKALEFSGEEGLDDFLILPATEIELSARLGRLLARTSRGVDLAVGGLRVDAAGREVTVDGRPINVTRKEYELLKYLIEHRGTVLGRGLLLERIWGRSDATDTRTVDVHIRRLRAKLGAPYGDLIRTVRHAGYLFSRQGPGEVAR